jgi:hypothetical protein
MLTVCLGEETNRKLGYRDETLWDAGMKRYGKDIKKATSNITEYPLDPILQDILGYLRLLICEVASLINF